MPDFSNGVATPGGASYMAPLLNFSNFSNWAADDPYQTTFKQQQQQINQQQIAEQQRKATIAQTFAGGLPIDPKTGQPDYAKAAAMLAKAGDPNAVWNSADAIAMQSAGNVSPLLSGGGQPAPGGGAAPVPQAAPVQPAQTPASPRGDSGTGTLVDLVTDKLPDQNQTTGQTIAKIASVMGVDPNAQLTPGQIKRAQGLLQKYAPDTAGPASFKDRFAAAGNGDLPPSANAVSPAPPAGPPAGAAPSAGAPAPQATPVPAAPPQGQLAPAAPQGGPITPQVPLPQGFTDPQKAILALRAEAARLSANPRAAGQVAELNNYAQRIEQSIQPVDVNTNTTKLDPRTGQVLYQGPGAALMSGSASRSGTIESDADVYRQTGKLPANIGRGIQGNAEAHAIRELAREQEIAEGGNPAEWPSRWQKFGAQATGRRVLESRAAGLELAENEASSLLPRVREASAKVSRTQYPSINALINAAKKGTGGTDVIKLGIAIESLVPVYARVLKPVGGLAQGDLTRAHDLLDKAWSDGQINAALDQMQVELGAARKSLDKTLDEYGVPKVKAGQSSAAPVGGGKPDADGWVSLPNGARIREIKAEGQ